MRSSEVVGLYGTDAPADRQRRALTSGRVPVAVYGLGKMGLPLAAVYAELTGNVTGVDIDEQVVETVNAGGTHVTGEPGLADLVSVVTADGSLQAVNDPSEAAEAARLHVAIVPTTLTEERRPDLAALEAVVESVAHGLSPGDLFVVESTVPPGTCRDLVEPTLAAASGLDPDEFGVAFCPERTASGRALRDIRGSYPKVVGGVDEESTRAAALVYDELVDNEVIRVSDTTTAECVKVFEGLYRDVNIALANELALVRDDLDVDVVEAISVANTQPYCDIHTPGAGVGGHCIPYYPYFVFDRVSGEMPLSRAARDVNDSMPRFLAETVVDGLQARGTAIEDATVAVLGLAYRPGVAETRASPAIPLVEDLSSRGARILVVDPVLDGASADYPLTPIEELERTDLDAAVLVTNHPEFGDLDWESYDSLVCVDGRDALVDLPDRHDCYVVGRGPN
ncbi:nucleotide sugar dehydrogenase [Halomarina salina]|uniref:UDP-N-acetyl-D-mannosamine dehydrogenase n=1 Tax=Halomarina salina TaxID=1872699 RepID=A0ABD5RHT8_9EURY|nr:nucleotide sugar dehydrogenase [Halomarina salina]